MYSAVRVQEEKKLQRTVRVKGIRIKTKLNKHVFAW